ncbi:optineurin-like isoform X2 [Anneissia japonica]|uniref:optineurin-like isoform X2 n=1 Tax=Anneissia japonica TaxID=1529436 RepID=UPI0014257E4F|nr:optineurin-like isoform X2 [Anneissia japonica]
MDNINDNKGQEDHEDQEGQEFEANLSSLQGDFVVLNYSGNDVDIATTLSDVHLSDNRHHTMLDEKNLIQSWEILKEENTNLKEQLKKMNQLLTKRIEEMKEMTSAQGKWMEVNETNHQRAKEKILSLQKENDDYKHSIESVRKDSEQYKHRLESVLKELGHIIQKEIDPDCKKYLEGISLQIMEGIHSETNENVEVDKTVPQSERMEGIKSEAKTDAQVKELNLKIAEMSEQLKCKDEQIDMIARELSEIKETAKPPTEMVLVSEGSKEIPKETPNKSSLEAPESFQEELTSMRDELKKVMSINTQLNEDLTSFQNLHTRNQSEIEALKGDLIKHQQMHEEKSKEFEKLRANIAKLQTDKEGLEQSLTHYQQHKSPPSDIHPPAVSTEVMVGSAPNTDVKNIRRQSSDDGETVQNLMLIFRAERQKCASLQEKLTAESNRVHELEMELLITQQELQTKNNKEISKREREHEMTVEDLNRKLDNVCKELEEARNYMEEPRYQSTGDDIRALKSQVMALMSELEEMNKQVEDANIQVQKRNDRIKQLELKNSVLASEQYNQSMQDTAIIERMQVEIKRLNEETSGLAVVIEERNDLLMKYQNLQTVYNDVCLKYDEARHKAVDEKEIEELTVKLISSEEALQKKYHQIKELQDEVKELQQFKDQCPALMAQADLYKIDFEAEREAREKAHSEKDVLNEQISRLKEEIEQLKEDSNPARKAALENLQRRHGFGSSQSQPMQPQPVMPPDFGAIYQRPVDYYPYGMGGYQHTGPPPNSQSPMHLCPVCQRNFPDIDTLQIHVMDCIN